MRMTQSKWILTAYVMAMLSVAVGGANDANYAPSVAEQLDELVGVYTLDASPKTTFTVRLEDGVPIGQINQ